MSEGAEIAQLLKELLDELGDDKTEESLGKIEKHLDKIEDYTVIITQTLYHPALTTSFADYTVTEALLLLLLLSAFISACARMLRGGFSWLRS